MSKLNQIFHWTYSGVLIPTFYSFSLAFWGIALATDSYEKFYIASLVWLLLGFGWSSCWIWTHGWLGSRKHTPYKFWRRGFLSSISGLIVSGTLAVWIHQTYVMRMQNEDLRTVHIVDVTALPESAGNRYVFQIDTENLSQKDLRGTLRCAVGKRGSALRPFGVFTGDATMERQFEDHLFYMMDMDELKDNGTSIVDLPAQKTQHGYCPSSWIPDQQEIDELGTKLTLYVAGRVTIPSRLKKKHVDIEFCRIGSEKLGLQNCGGHNVPKIHDSY